MFRLNTTTSFVTQQVKLWRADEELLTLVHTESEERLSPHRVYQKTCPNLQLCHYYFANRGSTPSGSNHHHHCSLPTMERFAAVPARRRCPCWVQATKRYERGEFHFEDLIIKNEINGHFNFLHCVALSTTNSFAR